MELLLSLKLAHSKFHGIPWKPMELLVSAKLAHSKSHRIPWNFSCQRKWRTSSSWNGIPWNCSCQRNWRTLSSMEFHGIPWNCSCQRNWRTQSSDHGIPWNCPYQRNWCIRSFIEFHGIPWNCSCHRNWRTTGSMEFHGTSRVIEIGALLVPWNSMELLVSAKLAHFEFHGISWNCSCHRNWRTCSCHRTSSMEFHGILMAQLLNLSSKLGTARVSEFGTFLVPWNSMELLVPWNSMELLVSAKLAHSKFHGIPCNFSCQRNWRTSSSMTNSMELLVSANLAHS